jgi:hypothetical protein
MGFWCDGSFSDSGFFDVPDAGTPAPGPQSGQPIGLLLVLTYP